MKTDDISNPMVLIADSHVKSGGDLEEEFFDMLSAIGNLTAVDVLFMGDNLDLWIASHPRYETDLHARFLSWCESQKAKRRVMIVEGNHEFYVVRHHGDCFTASSETFLMVNRVLFFHGDIAHQRFGFHRCFRAFAKNWFGDWVMSWLPFGPSFAGKMKRLLSTERRKTIPEIPLGQVSRRMKQLCHDMGVTHAVTGHFHQHIEHQLDEKASFTVLPAWKNDGEIGVIKPTGAIRIGRWQELLTELEAEHDRT